MGCHGNHEISKTQIPFIFEDNIFLHLSGPIGQIYAQNKMSDVFNLGLITPVAYYSLPMLFSIILRFQESSEMRPSEIFVHSRVILMGYLRWAPLS